MARDVRRTSSPKREDDAIRITTAASSPQGDIRGRQRRYLLSMGLRTVCFVGAIVAALAGLTWLWPILIAAALVLPYVAVVMANATASKSDGFELQDGDYTRRQLTPGTDSADDHD